MKNETIVVIKEGIIGSIVTDLVSFGCMIGLLYLNYNYLGNSWMVTALACFLLFSVGSTLHSKSVKRFNSKEEALKWLVPLQDKGEEAGGSK